MRFKTIAGGAAGAASGIATTSLVAIEAADADVAVLYDPRVHDPGELCLHEEGHLHDVACSEDVEFHKLNGETCWCVALGVEADLSQTALSVLGLPHVPGSDQLWCGWTQPLPQEN